MPPIRRATTYPTNSATLVVGIQDDVLVSNPGAGVDWSYTNASGYYRRLLTGYAFFVTSATVGNRTLGIKVTKDGQLYGRVRAASSVTASATVDVTYNSTTAWSQSGTQGTGFQFGFPYIWLPPGWSIGSDTVNLQAGDTFTLIRLLFDALDFDYYRQTDDHSRDLAHPTPREV
jgi:hypothetical protein